MTLLAPTEVPDLTIIEQRQPDVPLICTYRLFQYGVPMMDPCPKTAQWEALCFGCGHVFRRCEPHYQEDVADAALWDGSPSLCARCFAAVYLAQFVRLPA